MNKLDVLFIGNSTRDLLMRVDAPPASDCRIRASYFTRSCGGVAGTAAVAHNSLGGKTGLISAIGNDDTGIEIRSDMEKQGFQYLDFRVIPNKHSSTSMIQIEENGKRCLTCFGGCIEFLRFSDINPDALQNTKIVHIGVMDYDVATEVCEYIREKTSAKISIDGGNIPLQFANKLLPYTDYYIPDNKTAFNTLGLEPKDACRWYVDHGCTFAAITAAERGTWAWDGQNDYHIDALPVDVVDTTGAGDNFHGAFLFAVNQGWELARCIRFANIFASITCTGIGGRSAIPTLDYVLSLLDN